MIRPAEHSDIVDLAGLWARAFPGELSVDERVRHLETGGVFGGIETAWITERSNRIVGAFRAYVLTQHMHGTPYRMMGLAAVAVDETARRRGVGRELCEHAVRIARERGDLLSMLYPFRPAFYHALGWALVGELHAHRFRPESLIDPGGGARVQRAAPEDAAAIAACYGRVAASSNGMIARTPRVWRNNLDGSATHAYIAGGDGVRGYAIVRFGRASSPDEKPLFVQELVAEDHDAYESLLSWLAAQRDAYRLVHYDAHPDERFEHRLAEPRTPGHRPARFLWAPVARVIRGPMLRILDVKGVLERRVKWGPAAPLRFGLHVLDELVPENEGPWIVDYDGRRAALERGASQRPLLRLPVTTLAQVFAGEVTLREALMLGTAECDGDASAIDSLFRATSCFRLLDEF